MNITNKATAATMELRVVNGLLEHGITCDYEPGGLQEVYNATATKYGWQVYLDSDRLRVRILMFRSGLRLDVACRRRFDRWANSRVEFHWTYDEFFRRIAKEDVEAFLWAKVDEFEENSLS